MSGVPLKWRQVDRSLLYSGELAEGRVCGVVSLCGGVCGGVNSILAMCVEGEIRDAGQKVLTPQSCAKK